MKNLNVNPWKTVSKKTVYENPWIEVSHRDVINPSGGKGIYGMVHFKNTAIGIIPLDESLNTWIVGQYRYTLEQYSWEIPEGGGLIENDPLDGAKRELLEETGITAKKWTPIIEVHTSNSVTDEYGISYVAQDLSFGEAEPEETEDLIVRKLPFQEVFEMTMRGEITDGFAVASIFKLQFMLEKGLI